MFVNNLFLTWILFPFVELVAIAVFPHNAYVRNILIELLGWLASWLVG